MNKTCYFCEKLSPYDCKKYPDVKYLPNQYEYDTDKCDEFTPNADWLEYEGLLQRIIELEIGEKLIEKENEELKKQLNTIQKLAEKSYYQPTYSTTKMPTIKDISPLKETNSRWSNRTDEVNDTIDQLVIYLIKEKEGLIK